MIVIIIIAFLFHRLAKEANMNKYAWPAIAVGAYFVAQFIVGFILAIISPELIDSTGSQIVFGIISGALGVLIVYLVFQNVKKNMSIKQKDSDLIDTDL